MQNRENKWVNSNINRISKSVKSLIKIPNEEAYVRRLSRASPHEKMVDDYKLYSYYYWLGVRKRQLEYIINQSVQ